MKKITRFIIICIIVMVLFCAGVIARNIDGSSKSGFAIEGKGTNSVRAGFGIVDENEIEITSENQINP